MERRSILSGVPQGSHLGPLLFDFYINDVHRQFTYSKFLVYADDIKIYNRIICPRDASLLQSDLDNVANWCSENELPIYSIITRS